MKVNLKRKLEITINKINVEEGTYEIHYTFSLDGGPTQRDMYGSDYERWTEKEWLQELNDGEALNIVMQKIAEEHHT